MKATRGGTQIACTLPFQNSPSQNRHVWLVNPKMPKSWRRFLCHFILCLQRQMSKLPFSPTPGRLQDRRQLAFCLSERILLFWNKRTKKEMPNHILLIKKVKKGKITSLPIYTSNASSAEGQLCHFSNSCGQGAIIG